MIFQNTDCCVPIYTPAHCPYLYTRSIRNHKPNPNVYRSATTYQIPTSIDPQPHTKSQSLSRPTLFPKVPPRSEISPVPRYIALCTPALRYPHPVPDAKPEITLCKRTSRYAQRPTVGASTLMDSGGVVGVVGVAGVAGVVAWRGAC